MVHVPFFNVDLPEPKLGALIPDTVSAVLGCTAKALEYGTELLHPPSAADLKAYERSFEAQIPREFNRVRKRYAEGKIINDEQLSSELEDASFDWYRRQLRTSVIGATDEEMEDVAARKLGLRQPSLQVAVQEKCLADALADAGGIDLEAELRDAAEFQAMRAREEDLRREVAERLQRLTELRRQVRPAQRQALSNISNASGGLLAGVLLFKSALLLTRRIFKRRKPQQRLPPPQRRQAPQQPSAAAAATPPRAQAAAAVQQASAAPQGQRQAQQHSQSKAQGTSTTATATDAAAAAAAAARKPRVVKKR
ncbi:hypothetical protein VOLCADRAFT_105350 [Volvox carteri f. nagariensis]|uniref:Uncharacterized protein n=1 Tax=Volvox carteri f. nagariensis TaxID=3068 RepID=D8U0B0_VOLCA|nr:uncharacterized protein VOLCADRAFT_105350 [Volvox carteri f. nagariensis]EFJ46910.1 hypothetical protein VOLCADRAFT_105350 [Volvox carteri f. nagariensis]|eukprot:XP_002952119.1 hypothetical protein VOLCADRAFT_105350 [Volvox carteri f. nagariensis]